MGGNAGHPMRILIIQAEHRRWQMACSYPYCLNFGFEEALQAQGIEVLMVTSPWISQLRKLCGKQSFDQIWLNDLTHLAEYETPLDAVVDLAPTRIGFVTESIEYSAEEYATFAWLDYRRKRIEHPFAYVTHITAVDEHDVVSLQERYQKPTMWNPCSIPSRLLMGDAPMPTYKQAFFSGTPYGQRSQWLEEPALRQLLAYQPSTNSSKWDAALFNLLPGHYLNRLIRGRHTPARLIYPLYLPLLRRLRRRAGDLWLAGMQQGAAVVNLPHLVKGYSSRVIEGMAAGRPVISWRIPDRPRNEALFEDDKEILLYETPAELAVHIKRVLSDPMFARQIADNARRKVSAYHTTERRMQQILQWVAGDSAPTYGVDDSFTPSPPFSPTQLPEIGQREQMLL